MYVMIKNLSCFLIFQSKFKSKNLAKRQTEIFKFKKHHDTYLKNVEANYYYKRKLNHMHEKPFKIGLPNFFINAFFKEI